MIVARPDLVRRTIQLAAYTRYILEQLLFNPNINPTSPILRAKHQMYEHIRQRLRHDGSPDNRISPCQGFPHTAARTPRAAPWAVASCPFGASIAIIRRTHMRSATPT